jgi:ubiquitin-conjugating enzyme E2 S
LIVPNPESALNEEAGKLLLEQYDDYAKRAKLYTSIQAKSGKNEFLQLEKERSIDKTNENATVIKGSFIPSVLKPLSNATDLNTQKRQGEKEEEEKEVKKVKKSIVKKKALRRL